MGEVCRRVRDYCSAAKCTVDTLQQVANAMRIPYPLPDGLWDRTLKGQPVLKWIRWLNRWCDLYTDPTITITSLYEWDMYKGHVVEVAEWIYNYARRPLDAKEVWHHAMLNSAGRLDVEMFKFYFAHFDNAEGAVMPGIAQWDGAMMACTTWAFNDRVRMNFWDDDSAEKAKQRLDAFKEILKLYDQLYAATPDVMKLDNGLWMGKWTGIRRSIGRVAGAYGDLELLQLSMNKHVVKRHVLNEALQALNNIKVVESVDTYITFVKSIYDSNRTQHLKYWISWVYLLKRDWASDLLLWMVKNIPFMNQYLLDNGLRNSNLRYLTGLTVDDLQKMHPLLMKHLKFIGVKYLD